MGSAKKLTKTLTKKGNEILRHVSAEPNQIEPAPKERTEDGKGTDDDQEHPNGTDSDAEPDSTSSSGSSSESELDREELDNINRKRRELLQTAASGDIFDVLGKWQGTIVKEVIKTPIFVIIVCEYLAIRLVMWLLDKSPSDFPALQLQIVSGMVTFFLVFYTSQMFNRFNEQYKHAMDCQEHILNACSFAAASGMSYASTLRLQRHLNAAHVLAYIGLSETYTKENLWNHFNSQQKLLTPFEMQRIDAMDMNEARGSCYREVIVWCMKTAYEEHAAGKIDIHVRKILVQEINGLRNSIAILYHYGDQPVAFAYIHMVYALTAMYMPLLTFSIAVSFDTNHGIASDLMQVLLVLVATIFIIGLRILGQRLASPFGADLEDLCTEHYIKFTMANSRKICHAVAPPMLTEEQEITNDFERPSLGRLFTQRPEQLARTRDRKATRQNRRVERAGRLGMDPADLARRHRARRAAAKAAKAEREGGPSPNAGTAAGAKVTGSGSGSKPGGGLDSARNVYQVPAETSADDLTFPEVTAVDIPPGRTGSVDSSNISEIPLDKLQQD